MSIGLSGCVLYHFAYGGVAVGEFFYGEVFFGNIVCFKQFQLRCLEIRLDVAQGLDLLFERLDCLVDAFGGRHEFLVCSRHIVAELSAEAVEREFGIRTL